MPDLVVPGRRDDVSMVSHSPAAVHITVSTLYGQPLQQWTTLTAGQSVQTGLTTGHHYGYCYSQVATDGYAAAQACGGLTMHEYIINGARAPDGGTVQVTFRFTRGAASP
jgi:hypothetical protein